MSSPAADTTPRRGLALGGGAFRSGGRAHHVLAVIDLDAPRVVAEPVPTTFLPHGIALHPRDFGRVAVFEKHGPGACEVDLGARAVLRPVVTAASRSFYGHGAYAPDGATLFATETVTGTRAGVLVARDAATLAELGEVPTHGLAPHDCALIDEGRVMVVAHGGGPIDDRRDLARPCVTWVELASGRLLDRLALASPRYNAGHLALAAGGDLALVSAPRDGVGAPDAHRGALTLRPAGRPARTVEAPRAITERMRGETLSVLIDAARGTVAATSPLGDMLSLWRIDGTSLGALSVSTPRGVALSRDGAWLLLSHLAAGRPRITALDAATFAPAGLAVDPSFVTGSHLAVR